MIEPRIYRAAFLPALVVAVLLMFSFEERPPPVPQGLAADVLFDGRATLSGLRGFVEAHPHREPGSAGDAAAGRSVARSLHAAGFDTREDRFNAEGRPLMNVVATRPGASERRVVVLAARDAAHGADAAGSGADTAALLEMGRVFSGRATRKTIVLASVDGSSVGEAGARRFADTLEDPGAVDALLVMSGLGAPRARGPMLVEWSNDASRASIGLRRTAAAAMRQELGAPPGQEGVLGQLIRLGLPLGVGAQGPLIERGLPALRLSGSGELPPPELPVADVSVDRLGALGRTALRVVSAADAAPSAPEAGPRSYVLVARQVLPEWVVSALVLALILPVLVASVDAFARARRRREPVARWLLWTLAGAVPFVAALMAAEALGLTGAGPEGSSPPLPGAGGMEPGALAMLAGLVAVVALVWILGRSRLLRRSGRPFDPAAPGAACAIALIGSLLALLTWLANPFAALLLLPSVHLWMLATASPRESGARDQSEAPRLRARRLRLLLALAGLAVPVGVVAFYLQRLALSPLDGLWYGFSLVSGGHVATVTALAGCLFLGLVPSVAMVLVAAARRGPPPPPADAPKVSVRGPASYAGPGSLGGTESALRR